MTLVRNQVTKAGFEVVIRTEHELADLWVGDRLFGDYDLDAPDRHCTHSLDDVVGYVVFDNKPMPMSVVRTDLKVFVGRSTYGDALDFARKGQSVFSRGIGQLCKCGWRSY